jgi:hypothetical protein
LEDPTPGVPMPTTARSADLAAARAPPSALAAHQGERLGRAEQRRGVQVAVAGPHPLGELAHQLLPGGGRVQRRQAADELDHLDVAPRQPVDRPHHRLERMAPRQGHHLPVAEALVQPADGQAADAGQHVGLGAGLQHAGVQQPEAGPQGQLELLVAPGRVDDADLDDAELASLLEHARHVGPGRPQDHGHVVLGAVLDEVQPGCLGQQGGVTRGRHAQRILTIITCVSTRSQLLRSYTRRDIWRQPRRLA